jgi:hypothetical protein
VQERNLRRKVEKFSFKALQIRSCCVPVRSTIYARLAQALGQYEAKYKTPTTLHSPSGGSELTAPLMASPLVGHISTSKYHNIPLKKKYVETA